VARDVSGNIPLCGLPACALHPRQKDPFRSNSESPRNERGCLAPGCATHQSPLARPV
jgi:hypothetical protein